MKIGILGTGAIGTAVAYHLSQHKENELYLFNRSPRQGLSLTIDGQRHELGIDVQNEFENIPQFDWLIICIKEHHYAPALPVLRKFVNQARYVAIIRNGLRHKMPLLEFAIENQLLECLIDCPTQLFGANDYEQLKLGTITTPKGNLGVAFSQLFTGSQMQVKLSDDFKTESWKKLCESASLGAILCLSGETC